jgi:hypothetical protein
MKVDDMLNKAVQNTTEQYFFFFYKRYITFVDHSVI